jgi:hypothetical protein
MKTLLLATLVTGFFTGSETDMQTKFCYYETVKGDYVIVIDVIDLCPIEIEVDL